MNANSKTVVSCAVFLVCVGFGPHTFAETTVSEAPNSEAPNSEAPNSEAPNSEAPNSEGTDLMDEPAGGLLPGLDESREDITENDQPERYHEARQVQTSAVFGLRGAVFGAFSEADGTLVLPGGMALFRVSLIDGWLEAEIAGGVLVSDDVLTLPLKFLLKMPFDLTETTVAYLGLGPGLSVGLDDEGEMKPLLVHAAGLDYWLTENFALNAEWVYHLSFEETTTPEVGLTLGLLVGI